MCGIVLPFINMLRLFQFIASQLAVLTALSALFAYLYPPLFLIFKNYFLGFFAATMFAIGLVLKPADIRDECKQPVRIAQGVITQFSVMPILAFVVAQYPGFSPAVAMGFIIVGSAPGAMASNVIVYLAGGAVAYSVALTSVATVLSPLLTPLLVKYLGGAIMPVAFWPMMQTILFTVFLPLLAGLFLQSLMPVFTRQAKPYAPGVSALAIIIICSYAVAANQQRITDMGLMVLVAVMAVNILGYIIGWYLARLYGFALSHRVTLMIELGMQNAGMGVALALAHFPPEAALPGALFAVWCILTAAIASSWFRRYQRLNKQEAALA